MRSLGLEEAAGLAFSYATGWGLLSDDSVLVAVVMSVAVAYRNWKVVMSLSRDERNESVPDDQLHLFAPVACHFFFTRAYKSR